MARNISARERGELESKDWLGAEVWGRYKASLDEMLAYRKSVKGPPDVLQKACIDSNKESIAWYEGQLFHSPMLAAHGDCVCVRCAEKKAAAAEVIPDRCRCVCGGCAKK